jgi:hypothetical protein
MLAITEWWPRFRDQFVTPEEFRSRLFTRWLGVPQDAVSTFGACPAGREPELLVALHPSCAYPELARQPTHPRPPGSSSQNVDTVIGEPVAERQISKGQKRGVRQAILRAIE